MHYFKTYVENPIYLPYETHNHSKHLQSFGNRSFKPWNYSQSFNFQFLCWRKQKKNKTFYFRVIESCDHRKQTWYFQT